MNTADSVGIDDDTFDAVKFAHEIDVQGYTIIPDTLSADQVRDATTAILEVYGREREIAQKVKGQTDHALGVHHLFAKHQYFEEFYLNPKVTAVCRCVLGDDMVVTETHARSILPSSGREARRGFQIHVDREAFSILPFKGGSHHYPMALNTVWFLVDFTEDNGATVVWPGTHKLNQVPDPDADLSDVPQATAVGPAGSCVVWDAALWHASGRNHSTQVRHSVIGFYHRKWIRGTINVEHVIPRQVLARMSPEMHRLIGHYDWPPEYSEVKELTPEKIADLTPAERDILGFMIY